jgi:CheY-like chemotaxis protein
MLLLDLRDIAERTIGGVRHQVASVPTLGTTARTKPRVLIVEDSIGVRELERVILEGAGYQVTTAIDGLDGAAKLRAEPADLVVSDVEMPGMDGFTLTRTIRRTKGWESVPVILMTSRNDDADKRAGLEAGATAYLFKQDFDQHELVDTVRRLIGR